MVKTFSFKIVVNTSTVTLPYVNPVAFTNQSTTLQTQLTVNVISTFLLIKSLHLTSQKNPHQLITSSQCNVHLIPLNVLTYHPTLAFGHPL